MPIWLMSFLAMLRLKSVEQCCNPLLSRARPESVRFVERRSRNYKTKLASIILLSCAIAIMLSLFLFTFSVLPILNDIREMLFLRDSNIILAPLGVMLF